MDNIYPSIDTMTKTLQLTKPDDAHIHLRDGVYLTTTVPAAAKQFSRAIVMPNLKPPVITLEQVLAYRDRIVAALPAASTFTPLMTLYLTDAMTPAFISEAAQSKVVTALKLYPAGVTTNSAAGVTDIQTLYPVFAAMQSADLPLLIHGETNDPSVDIFDREKYFLATLAKLVQEFPYLRIVLEHITTQDAVEFIQSAPANVAATITAHHLLFNRNQLLSGGIKPHYYCLPILKRHQHQLALIKAATSGNPKFFLGTDSAPHAIHAKETACGCAGIYSAHAAIELYAQAFALAGALDKLEAFASHYAADFYRLPRNVEKITLVKNPWRVPSTLAFGDEILVPLWAGEILDWRAS